MCRVSRRFQFLFLEVLEHRSRQLGRQIVACRRLELIRGRRGSLEVLIQFLDGQLEILAAWLKCGALDQRDRALQDRGSFLRVRADAFPGVSAASST